MGVSVNGGVSDGKFPQSGDELRAAFGFTKASQQPLMDVCLHGNANANITQSSIATAAAFISANVRSVTKVDLTNYTEARLLGSINNVNGPADSNINLRYSTTFDATPGNYLAAGAAEIKAALSGGQNTYFDSGWAGIVSAARTDVFIAAITTSGDATTSPTIGSVHVQFR